MTTPTTTAETTNKIKPSSAAALTSTRPVVGVLNAGQHPAAAGATTYMSVVIDTVSSVVTRVIEHGPLAA